DSHDLLAHENTPDARTLVRRRDERARKRFQGFVNPFALRVPATDPSALLRRLDKVARVLFSTPALWVWLVAMGFAAAAAASRIGVMTAHAREYMLTPRYLVLTWLAFPIVKGLHELGHALAVRRW